jgi:hypothetical protein
MAPAIGFIALTAHTHAPYRPSEFVAKYLDTELGVGPCEIEGLREVLLC